MLLNNTIYQHYKAQKGRMCASQMRRASSLVTSLSLSATYDFYTLSHSFCKVIWPITSEKKRLKPSVTGVATVYEVAQRRFIELFTVCIITKNHLYMTTFRREQLRFLKQDKRQLCLYTCLYTRYYRIVDSQLFIYISSLPVSSHQGLIICIHSFLCGLRRHIKLLFTRIENSYNVQLQRHNFYFT